MCVCVWAFVLDVLGRVCLIFRSYLCQVMCVSCFRSYVLESPVYLWGHARVICVRIL